MRNKLAKAVVATMVGTFLLGALLIVAGEVLEHSTILKSGFILTTLGLAPLIVVIAIQAHYSHNQDQSGL